MQNLGIWVIMGIESQNMSSKVPYLESLTLICLSLCNFYGATMMLKGSLLLSAPIVQLDRLQSVLNAAARLIYRRRKFDHVSPLLKELHWLPVPERITFRLAVLAYRCQHNTAPRYLTAQLQQASNIGYRQRLRSSSSAKLDGPRTEHVTIGGRAFSSTAAQTWNSLPTAVQSSE